MKYKVFFRDSMDNMKPIRDAIDTSDFFNDNGAD